MLPMFKKINVINNYGVQNNKRVMISSALNHVIQWQKPFMKFNAINDLYDSVK